MGGVDPYGGWGPTGEGGQQATDAASRAGVPAAAAYNQQQQQQQQQQVAAAHQAAASNQNPVGTPAWWTAEIANREAVAKATTVEHPGVANLPNQTPVGSQAWYAQEIAARELTARSTTVEHPGTANLPAAATETMMVKAPFLSTYRTDADNATLTAMGGIPLAMYGMGQEASKRISDAQESTLTFSQGVMPKVFPQTANTLVGFGGNLAGMVPLALSLPYALTWSAYHPTAVPSKAYELGTQMVEQTWKDEQKHPGTLLGTLGGMYVGGKVIGYGAGKVGEVVPDISPVELKIGVPIRAAVEGEFNYVSTVSIKNPFSNAVPVPKAYAISGVDVTGTKIGFGSPVKAMGDLTITADPMFIVRDAAESHVMTNAQRMVLDPFFRSVAKGTPEEPIINAMFDIKANIGANVRGGSEDVLRYTNAQPAGTLTQEGVDAAVQANVHDILAKGGAVRLGSAAQTDWLGSRFMRDTIGSDIDVDVPKVKLPATVEELKVAYAQNPTPIEFQGGGRFALKSNPTDHIIGASEMEGHLDVRYLEAKTASGKPIGQQTPEYGIESKASRTLKDRIKYTPDDGLTVKLTGKKIEKDLSDIYAGARGISKTAYEQNQFRLGQTYEDISNNIKTYAETKGVDTVIKTIPEDILKTPEGINAKAIAGIRAGVYNPQISGVDVGIPKFARAVEEYPTTVEPRTVGGYPSIPIGMYPMGTMQPQGQIAVYPTAQLNLKSDTFPYPSTQQNPVTTITVPVTPYPVGPTPEPQTTVYPIGNPNPPPPTPVYPMVYPPTPPNPPVPVYPTVYPPNHPNPPTPIYPTGTPPPTTNPPTIPLLFKDIVNPFEQVKPRKQRGKRFGEVFSLVKYPGFKVPKRMLTRPAPKHFGEVFSLVKGTPPKIKNPFKPLPMKGRKKK
jgi:hypothetical protein